MICFKSFTKTVSAMFFSILLIRKRHGKICSAFRHDPKICINFHRLLHMTNYLITTVLIISYNKIFNLTCLCLRHIHIYKFHMYKLVCKDKIFIAVKYAEVYLLLWNTLFAGYLSKKYLYPSCSCLHAIYSSALLKR